MNPQQARERVAETFPQSFDRVKFLEFSRNLLNKFDESKAAQWNAIYVKDAFKPHVSRFERLGTYTSPDDEKLDVLVVHLTNESKLERARTAIRNFVADHLKTRDEKDAALVAFVSPTEQQWRFSYVKMEYAAVETESGKVGVETRLTPARRFSYNRVNLFEVAAVSPGGIRRSMFDVSFILYASAFMPLLPPDVGLWSDSVKFFLRTIAPSCGQGLAGIPQILRPHCRAVSELWKVPFFSSVWFDFAHLWEPRTAKSAFFSHQIGSFG